MTESTLLGEPLASPATDAPPANATNTDGGSTPASTPAADAVPEKYDFKAAEGVTLDEPTVAEVTALAKELGLTKSETAQKLLDHRLATTAAAATAQAAELATRRTAWEDEVRNDPTMGGAQFDQTISHAKNALARFDTSGELRKMLNDSGYGSNPAVVKLFSAIGKAMAEDKFIGGGAPKAEPISLQEHMFGKA